MGRHDRTARTAHPVVRTLPGAVKAVLVPWSETSDDDLLPAEPAFLRMLPTDLELDVDMQQARLLLDHFTYEVRHAPRDLTAHVRRVLLALRLADAQAVCAAMVDLACVLVDKGQDLRVELFARVETLLDTAQFAQLSRLVSTAPSVRECSNQPGSVLLPAGASRPVVRRSTARAECDDVDMLEVRASDEH